MLVAEVRKSRKRPNRRVLLTIALLIVSLVLGSVALARSSDVQVPYYSGSMDGWPYLNFGTFVNRQYNNAYHACSSYTATTGSTLVQYDNSSGATTHISQDGYGTNGGCVNPSHLGNPGGARDAVCSANQSGITPTDGDSHIHSVNCQTTRP